MILTAEEYARGFIDFDAVLPEGCRVELWTRTADRPEDEGEWTGPYSMPEGSKVLSLPKQYMQLRMELKRGDDPTKTPIISKVRWERGGKTFIWPGKFGFNGPPAAFSLGRDYGCSYRIVFHPKKASWPESLVVIDGEVRIRFCKEGLTGHNILGFEEAVPTPDGNFSVEGTVEETELKEELVEVLATVSKGDEAEMREAARTKVETVTGLLALCLGEEILGESVFEDWYVSYSEGEQGEIYLPFKQLKEQSIDKESAYSASYSLEQLQSSPLSTSLGLALRWYAKGLGSHSPVDSFVAYFIGLETLASGHFASLDSTPRRIEYVRLQEYFNKAKPPISNELRDIVLERMADYPLTLKFREYWKSRFHKETKESGEFGRYSRLRSEILHGKARVITRVQVNSVQRLLERLLAKNLGLDKIIEERQKGPSIIEATLQYIMSPREPDP